MGDRPTRWRAGRRWRSVLAVSVTAVLAVSAAACGDDDDASDGATATTATAGQTTATGGQTTAAKEEPRRGGSVTFVNFAEPPNLAVANTFGLTSVQTFDGPYLMAIYDMLVWENPQTNRVEPRLATSLRTDDGVTWTLELRPNVKFSDGTPFDAEAVKFNWEYHADPASRSRKLSSAALIESMEARSPTQLVIRLKQANRQFDRVVAQQLGFIGSPTAMRAMGDQFGLKPVGAGPFVVESYALDIEARLKRNPNYWDAPRPYLDELIIREITDNEQRANTFRTGQAQIANSGPDVVVPIRLAKEGFNVRPGKESVLGSYFIMNLQKEPFNDIDARRAITRALNRKGWADTVLDGGVEPVYTLFEAPSPFADPSVTVAAYDKQEAQRLIDAYAAKVGHPLRFRIATSTLLQTTGEYFQAQLGEFRNLEVSVQVIPAPEVFPTHQRGDFELAYFAGGGIDPDPAFMDRFHSKGSLNTQKYANPEVDAQLERSRIAADPNERVDAFRRVQKALVDDAVLVPLARQTNSFMLGEDVRVEKWANGVPFWAEVWLAK